MERARTRKWATTSVVVGMATLGLTMALTVATATVASAAGEESRLVGLTNGLRASVGVPALVVDGNLSAVAAQWAAEMAAGGSLAHNPNLGSQVAAWDRLGENVGVGNDIDQVWVTLTNSAAHYANLVDSGYTLIGTGSASSGGRLYVVQDFAQVSTPAPSPVIAEPAPVIAEPAPEPEPAPAFVPTFIPAGPVVVEVPTPANAPATPPVVAEVPVGPATVGAPSVPAVSPALAALFDRIRTLWRSLRVPVRPWPTPV